MACGPHPDVPPMIVNEEDEVEFPFHPATPEIFEGPGSLSFIDQTNFEPPVAALRRKYYESKNGVEDKYKSSISNPGKSEAQHSRSRGWQAYKKGDFQLDTEVIPILPNGHWKQQIYRPNAKNLLPYLTRLTYKGPSKDNKADPEEETTYEDGAAEFQAYSRNQFLIGGGHDESQISTFHEYCTNEFYGEQRKFNEDNGIPNCR